MFASNSSDTIAVEVVLRGRQGTIGEKHSTREPRVSRRVSGKKQFYEGSKRKQ